MELSAERRLQNQEIATILLLWSQLFELLVINIILKPHDYKFANYSKFISTKIFILYKFQLITN
jgi:hypothetical protein